MLDMHRRVAGKVLAARLSVAVSVLNLVNAPSNGRFGVAGATCHLVVCPSLPYICVGIGAFAIWANANLYLENLCLELLEQSLMPKGFWPAFSQMISTDLWCQFHCSDLDGRSHGLLERAGLRPLGRASPTS